MKILKRKRIPWKGMGMAALRLVGHELEERLRGNLTPAERRELGELALRSRDALHELATDAERRRLGQLMAKALTGRAPAA